MAARLKRDSAGAYHTTDRRFAVQREGTAWYVRDAKRLDELGLPLVIGPYPSLDAAREALESQPPPEAGRPRRPGR